MKSKAVRLKGTREGFAVTLDTSKSYDLLEKEAGKLFANMKQLAEGAKVSVEAGKGSESVDLIKKLGEYLKGSFGVSEVFEKVYEKEHRSDDKADKADDIPEAMEMGEVKMLAGRVRSGQKVVADNHLVILGDVNPGGEVVAGGDILILGSLCGTAIAGQADNETSVILALDFRPTQVQIAGVVAAGVTSSADKNPEFAFIEDGAIVVDNYATANPFGKLPVLEER